MDALPAALRARGHEVCVALPFYREIRENRAFKTKNTGIAVDVQVGEKVYRCPIPRGAKCQWRAVGSWFAAMNFLIATEFTANGANPMRITPRDLSFFARRRWSYLAD